MILFWMLIASLVALAVGAAALAVEGAARALRRPGRWPWVAALTFSALWPAWLAVRGHIPLLSDGGATSTATSPAIFVSAGRAAFTTVAHRLAPLDGRISLVILIVWFAVSAALLVRLLLGMRSLNRQRSRWVAHDVDGVRLLVAPATGPAVIGVREPAIVLPEWALGLEPTLRQVVLRHEVEHLRARDTVLRLAGAVLPALMPWNIPLWWQAGRLSLAIEVDCDARVLRADVPRERYGLLLLAIAQRQSTPMFAPALSEPTSHLERRVTAMQRSLPTRPVLAAAGLTLVAAICIALACSAPSPESPAGQATQRTASNASAPKTDRDRYFDFQVSKQAAPMPGNPQPRYPDALQAAKISGQVVVQFVIDTSGHPEMDTFKVVQSDNDLFVQAVKDVLPQQRFYPAEVGGRHVKELVTTPYVFDMKP